MCPISPKKDTTHQVKPIVETQEYLYFLYICILILTPRSQPPPLLSWFDHLNMIMHSPHMSFSKATPGVVAPYTRARESYVFWLV